MSTAGKVLVVLTGVIMPIVMIILSAGVAELNSVNAKRTQDLVKQVGEVEAKLAQTELDVISLRDGVNFEHVAKETDLRIVRTNLSTAQSKLASTIESLSRIQILVANYAKTFESAKEGLALRNKEKADVEKDIAAEKALVEELRQGNAKMVSEMTQLRERFITLLDANSKKIQRVSTEAASAR